MVCTVSESYSLKHCCHRIEGEKKKSNTEKLFEGIPIENRSQHSCEFIIGILCSIVDVLHTKTLVISLSHTVHTNIRLVEPCVCVCVCVCVCGARVAANENNTTF